MPQPEFVRVVPSPDLPTNEYLPGIGAAGADLPADVAEDLIKRGLAVKSAKKPEAPPASEKQE